LPIPITEPWTATGVAIDSGDTVVIIMNGLATTDYTNPNLWAWTGPEGEGYLWTNNLVVHSVIGKISDSGTPFQISRGTHFRALISGELYIGYNDDQFADNYGYYLAYILAPSVGVGAGTTGVQQDNGTIPSRLGLGQNYPNPFNPTTTIEYQVARQGIFEIGIYDNNGRLVKTLLNSEQHPGSYVIQWDGKSNEGKSVSSGTYFYQVKSNGVQLVKKMLLLK
jgi:hypothetical protein